MAKKNNINNSFYSPALLNKSKIIFKEELSKRINLGNDIINSVESNSDLAFLNKDYSFWNDYNLELLRQSFDESNNEYWKSYRYAGESGPAFSIVSFDNYVTREAAFSKSLSLLKSKIVNLSSLLNKVDLLKSSSTVFDSSTTFISTFSDVFIVHGHDDSVKNEVARFIHTLHLNPIILHEQASSGKTIIEKIEDYTDVNFGIVLYTPCDKGSEKNSKTLNKRARQNVVFEHGFLIGKIGRKNVCALVKGDIEKPSDISGINYIPMDSDWKINLAKELKKSGFNIDMNLFL